MSPHELVPPAHHVCAWLTVERYLLQARLQQVLRIRKGIFRQVEHVAALQQLALYVPMGVCGKTKQFEENQIPPLLPLLSALPPEMQANIEQAIEAERRGEASHEVVEFDEHYEARALAVFTEAVRLGEAALKQRTR